MSDSTLLFTALHHRGHSMLTKLVTGADVSGDDELGDGPFDGADRGAVSIEQVLWYAAAAVSVAVVAAIIWNQIKTTASTGVNTPSAP